MSDHLPDRPTDPLIESRLWRSLRPTRLSQRQRARHLQRLDEREEDDMRYLQQRSRAELWLLATALVTVLVVATWLAWPDDDGDEPGQLEMAQATLTARINQSPTGEPTSSDDSAAGVAAVATTRTSSPGAGAACMVDMPATNVPASVPQADPSYHTWYGNEDSNLWMSPVDRAAVLPPIEYPPGNWFAGSDTYVMWFGVTEPIQISGKRLDAEGEFAPEDPQSASDINEQARIQFHDFVIPEPGCWEITGTTDTDELSVTVEVMPYTERPDWVFATAIYDLKPYPEPAACQASPWTGPEPFNDSYVSLYWLESDLVRIGLFDGWLYAHGAHSLTLLMGDENATVRLEARSIEGSAPQEVSPTVHRNSGNLRTAELIFPSAGCWELETITESGSETFTVYVYPEECRPHIPAMEIGAECQAPAAP